MRYHPRDPETPGRHSVRHRSALYRSPSAFLGPRADPLKQVARVGRCSHNDQSKLVDAVKSVQSEPTVKLKQREARKNDDVPVRDSECGG